MTELRELRKARDGLERRLDELHREHERAVRTARRALSDVDLVQADLRAVTARLEKLKP
jgi:hypothetical protein